MTDSRSTSPGATSALPLERWRWAAAIIVFWIAAAAMTGFLHGLELFIARRALGQLVWFSREFVWMSPIAYALVMAPGAVVLAILAAARPRTWVLSFSAAAFGTVGAFGLLLPYSQVSRLSALILSIGVGVMMARSVQAGPIQWMRRARLVAVGGVAAVAVLAPAQRVFRAVRESRALASLPPVEGGTNVLIVILDTVRAASMGLYSVTDSTTPRLDDWSRSSTLFDWAFSPSSWTLPSHGSMFTGAWANEQSGNWEVPLDRTLPTLTERFRDRGYATGAFVANMHYTAWDSGLPRGFARYEDYLVNWRQLSYSSSYTQTAMYAQLRRARTWSERIRAVLEPNLYIDPKHRFALKRGEAVTTDFLDWQAANADRPFFAFLNYYDAHQPYYAPEAFRRFQGEDGLAMYRAAIAYLDSELDRLMSALRERGVLDNTLVIITSDHGELFGFKGLHGHAHNLYLNTIRVPLMLRLPGRVAEGVRINQPVTLRDLAATVMDLAAPGDTTFPGVSLSGTWRDAARSSPVLVEVRQATNIEPHLPTARGDMQALLDEQFQYIRNAGDGRQELFAYRADTLQERDLATVDSTTLATMRQRVLDLLRLRR